MIRLPRANIKSVDVFGHTQINTLPFSVPNRVAFAAAALLIALLFTNRPKGKEVAGETTAIPTFDPVLSNGVTVLRLPTKPIIVAAGLPFFQFD